MFIFISISYMVQQQVIKPLCEILDCPDNKIIQVALDGIDNILKAGAEEALSNDTNTNPYALLVEEFNGLDKIYELQNHEHNTIYEKSKSIIDKFFSGEDEFENATDSRSYFETSRSFGSVPQGGFSF